MSTRCWKSCDSGEGEVVVIIGPSGSGKSTFFRCLNQLEEVTEGQTAVTELQDGKISRCTGEMLNE